MRLDHEGVVWREGGEDPETGLPGGLVEDLGHDGADAFFAKIFVKETANEAFLVDACSQEKISNQVFLLKCTQHDEGIVFELFFDSLVCEIMGFEIASKFWFKGV